MQEVKFKILVYGRYMPGSLHDSNRSPNCVVGDTSDALNAISLETRCHGNRVLTAGTIPTAMLQSTSRLMEYKCFIRAIILSTICRGRPK
jgi:hypothetical protein